jgi:hypothetical protein
VTEQHSNDTAGTGSPVPAVSSTPGVTDAPEAAEPPARGSSHDVVPPEARLELDRIRRRWAELPLERADAGRPVLRGLLARLAERSADGAGHEVPDLGPAVAVDQLAVLVWDAYAVGRGHGIPELLAALRRDLG